MEGWGWGGRRYRWDERAIDYGGGRCKRVRREVYHRPERGSTPITGQHR